MDSVTLAIFVVAVIWMLVLAKKDSDSLKSGDHTDYKSVIVSIGVLGTFIGIVIGLWEFDTAHIDESVPKLLEGLKFAFVTSIAGMSISVLLSSIQKSNISGGDDELSILKEINSETKSLRDDMDKNIRDLRNVIEVGSNEVQSSNKEIVKGVYNLVTRDDVTQFRNEIHKTQITQIDFLGNQFSKTNEILSNFGYQVEASQKSLFDFLSQQFTKTNESLDKAIEVLAEGATEEIINALNGVISDFNKNLVEQFGDSFKQLNQAVDNLVSWQDKFKEIVEKDHALLVEVRASMSDSAATLEKISEKNNEVTNIYTSLGEIIKTYHNEIESVNQQLKVYEEIGSKASEAFDKLSNGFDGVQSGMEGQSEAITKLTSEIAKKLPESLGELENTLVGLTDRFKDDYQSMLDNHKRLIERLN